MKCQKCDKSATFHITELSGGTHHELHLCEEHAHQYLTQSNTAEAGPTASLAGALAQQLAVGQTAEELAKLDQKACTICGITFYEFRNQGRLGCPHDYVFFEKELEPLIVNIHGETHHTGKQPRKHFGGTDRRTDLIRLRREIKQAVSQEDYERASRLRDDIRKIEQSEQQ